MNIHDLLSENVDIFCIHHGSGSFGSKLTMIEQVYRNQKPLKEI